MEKSNVIENEFLSLKEAAVYLKRSPGNLYNLVCAGTLRHYKPGGGKLLFKKTELQAWIEAGAVASNDEIAAQAASRS